MDLNYIMQNRIVLTLVVVALIGGVQPLFLKYIIGKNIPRKYILFSITSINLILYLVYFNFINTEHLHSDEIKENESTDPLNGMSICLLVLYTAICITLPNILYMQAIGSENIISMNALLYISPFFTLIIAYLLFNENITFNSILGACLIIAGSILVVNNDMETN